jgi:hypothetical protein
VKLKMPSAKVRKYVYRVATAGLAVAGFYGLVTQEEAAVWGSFLGVALVTGMADANTPAASDDAAG